MIHVILAEAEVELLPSTVKGRLPDVRILDSFLDGDMVRSLPDPRRRGRADVAHSALLLLLSSEQFEHGHLRVWLHTRGDEVIEIGPRAQVQPNYLDFLVSLSALYDKGALGEGEAKWSIERHTTLDHLLSRLAVDAVLLLSPRGERIPLEALLNELHHMDLAIVVGAFPEGDFPKDTYSLADHVVSLSEKEMTVPSVICELLSSLRH